MFSHPLSAVYRRVSRDEMTADPELRTLRNTRDDYERALADAGLAP